MVKEGRRGDGHSPHTGPERSEGGLEEDVADGKSLITKNKRTGRLSPTSGTRRTDARPQETGAGRPGPALVLPEPLGTGSGLRKVQGALTENGGSVPSLQAAARKEGRSWRVSAERPAWQRRLLSERRPSWQLSLPTAHLLEKATRKHLDDEGES